MSMGELGVSAKPIRLIGICAQMSKRVIKFNGLLSSVFSSKTGLRQEDALSPMPLT